MLDDIGLKYGTDKASNGHNYLQVYEQIMPSVRPVNLLEIGWFDGASMRMWREYLHEESTIIGVDIEPKDEICGVEFVQANATQYELLTSINWLTLGEAPGLDFIIDDGSHLSPDVIASLEMLWDLVRPGGYYIVEDLHVSYHENWKGWDPSLNHVGTTVRKTSMEFLKKVADDVHFGHAGAGPWRQQSLPDVASIAFYPGLAIIQKKA